MNGVMSQRDEVTAVIQELSREQQATSLHEYLTRQPSFYIVLHDPALSKDLAVKKLVWVLGMHAYK